MNGEGRRQLPSWMIRPCTLADTPSSLTHIEIDSHQLDTIASPSQPNLHCNIPYSALPLLQTESLLPHKCPIDTKSCHPESLAFQNDSRTPKRMFNQGYNLAHSNLEKDDGPLRKKPKPKTPVNHKKKKKKTTNISLDGTLNSQDELTLDDLVTIALEYVNADMVEQKNLEIHSETRSSNAMIRSEKVSTAEKEDHEFHTIQPLSAESFLSDPQPGEGSISYPINTGDPVQDMLDLLFGGLLKKSEVAERMTDAATNNIMLEHELSKTSKDDAATEVVPAMKKKTSLKDKVALLSD